MKYIAFAALLLVGCKPVNTCTVCVEGQSFQCLTTEGDSEADVQDLIDYLTGGDPSVAYTVDCD